MRSIFLAVDGNRGVYAPQQFCKIFGDSLKPAEGEYWTQQDIRATVARLLDDNPDSEQYWEDWDAIHNAAVLTDEGEDFFIFQDDDIWCIPIGWEWDDDEGWKPGGTGVIETPEEQEYREDLHDNDEFENT